MSVKTGPTIEEEPGLRTPEPTLGGAAPAPELFDETTSPGAAAEAEADFAPLPELDGSAAVRDLREIDPYQYDSIQAQEAFDSAAAAAAAGDEETAIREYLRASKTAETAREWYLSAVACQRVADFLVDPKPPMDFDRAFRLYRRAAAAYERCGLFAEAREVSVRQMYLKMVHGRELGLPLTQRLELYVHWAVAGFGHRPLRVVGMTALIVLAYGLAYWLTGGAVHAVTARPADFWQSIYFSGITFGTVGYGDFLPAPHTRMLALTEGFVGAFTMGFFVAVLANRLSKS